MYPTNPLLGPWPRSVKPSSQYDSPAAHRVQQREQQLVRPRVQAQRLFQNRDLLLGCAALAAAPRGAQLQGFILLREVCIGVRRLRMYYVEIARSTGPASGLRPACIGWGHDESLGQ